MQKIVQFLQIGDVFMSRGQRHTVGHAYRVVGKPKTDPYVLVTGVRADGEPFEAEFPWGDSVDIVNWGRVSGP